MNDSMKLLDLLLKFGTFLIGLLTFVFVIVMQLK